jgi:RNA polymerase sigma-70 factor (ECF subfamily)
MSNRLYTRTSLTSRKPVPATPHRDASDDALMAKVAEGNRLAMQLLFVRHHSRVYRFLLRMLRNTAAAEDISSEVFLAVWQQASRFRGSCSVSTWLLSIARNKALSELRDGHGETIAKDEVDIADAAEDPEVVYTAKRRRELLRNCLARLSRDHREILDLVYYHDKSVPEVAHILGIPRNTVKTRMFYARKKLSKLIQARGLLRAGL